MWKDSCAKLLLAVISSERFQRLRKQFPLFAQVELHLAVVLCDLYRYNDGSLKSLENLCNLLIFKSNNAISK